MNSESEGSVAQVPLGSFCRSVAFTCSEHGPQAFKSFCFGGIELACGCQFLKVNGEPDLRYFDVPPWKNKMANPKAEGKA